MKESPGNSSVFSVCGTFFSCIIFKHTNPFVIYYTNEKKLTERINDSSRFCALLLYIFSCRSRPMEKLCISHLVFASSELCWPFFNRVSEVCSQ